MVSAGRVTVNGNVAVPGTRVHVEIDEVRVDGHLAGIRPGTVHYPQQALGDSNRQPTTHKEDPQFSIWYPTNLAYSRSVDWIWTLKAFFSLRTTATLQI